MSKKTKAITLVDLLRAAGCNYPDQEVSEYWKKCPGKNDKVKLRLNAKGDTLAKFIAIELVETYKKKVENDEKIDVAVGALDQAVIDLHQAIRGLEDLRRKRA